MFSYKQLAKYDTVSLQWRHVSVNIYKYIDKQFYTIITSWILLGQSCEDR